MAEITLVAEVGRKTGSAESRRLRNAGRVPAVVYGHGMEPVAVSVNGRDLRAALSGNNGMNQILTLEVGGSRHMVLPRQLQRHPVRRTVAHVDFQVVGRDEVVHAEVPVVLAGTAVQVERERGLVEHVLANLSIRATPQRIPTEVTVDISSLAVGDVVRVRDLALPPGVTTDVDPDETVVIAAASAVGGASEEGAAEAGQGAAGEAAEG